MIVTVVGDQAALFEGFLEAELVLRSRVGGSGEDFKKHAIVLSKGSRK
jgi:hypothetical protein